MKILVLVHIIVLFFSNAFKVICIHLYILAYDLGYKHISGSTAYSVLFVYKRSALLDLVVPFDVTCVVFPCVNSLTERRAASSDIY